MRVRMVTDPTWGDNGKGKVTDFLLNGPWAGQVAVNARWNGGPNAGHRVMRNGRAFDLHMIPSSILTRGVESLIAPNCVVNVQKLIEIEIPALRELGVDLSWLRIAREAFVIMPWHQEQEQAEKEAIGGTGLGTTLQGIGPAYADITGRHALLIGDLLNRQLLRERLEAILPVKNLIPAIQAKGWTVNKLVEEYLNYGERLKPHIVELDPYLAKTLARLVGPDGVLCLEGAQGAALDIHAPNYPYNTSSGCTAYDAWKIFRIGPGHVEYSLAVTKVYCTSVGRRDFPTKMPDDQAKRIRKRGDEYGVTSGRERDCGWLDLPMLRHGAKMMRATHWFLTKLDVLDEEPEILVCSHYKRGNEKLLFPPRYGLGDCVPNYVSLPGWRRETRGTTKLGDLPSQARGLIHYIENETKLRAIGISTGPEPHETIWLG